MVISPSPRPCVRTGPTCLAEFARGWINTGDFCSGCIQRLMIALDWVNGAPLTWNPATVQRAYRPADPEVAHCPGCGSQLPENAGCQVPGCDGIPPAPAQCGQPATRAVVAYPIPYGLRIHTHFTCSDHFDAAVAGIEAAGLHPEHGPGILPVWGTRCGDVTSRDGGDQ